uniref:Uncharacterized protein n=1 Tax=Rhizophora mucronata TaxID=61149 RepID=A0A2P2QDY0_RHIMU
MQHLVENYRDSLTTLKKKLSNSENWTKKSSTSIIVLSLCPREIA